MKEIQKGNETKKSDHAKQTSTLSPITLKIPLLPNSSLKRSRCLEHLCQHNPRARNVAVPTYFFLVLKLSFSHRDLQGN